MDTRLLKLRYDPSETSRFNEATVAALQTKNQYIQLRRKPRPGSQLQGTTQARRRYGRVPDDPSVTDYACMTHRVDKHTEYKGNLTRSGKPQPARSNTASAATAHEPSNSESSTAAQLNTVPSPYLIPIPWNGLVTPR